VYSVTGTSREELSEFLYGNKPWFSERLDEAGRLEPRSEVSSAGQTNDILEYVEALTTVESLGIPQCRKGRLMRNT
jgi:hypothetical protein